MHKPLLVALGSGLLGGVLLAACSAETPEQSEIEGTLRAATEEPAPSQNVAELLDNELDDTGEAGACLTAGGNACRAACWGAVALGCGAVTVACTGTTVITIGGTSIPCAWAAVAACTATTVGGSLCADHCPP